MSSAVDTLCGQAFGAGSYRLVGVVFQRALAICALAALPPLLFFLLGAQQLLQLLGGPGLRWQCKAATHEAEHFSSCWSASCSCSFWVPDRDCIGTQSAPSDSKTLVVRWALSLC